MKVIRTLLYFIVAVSATFVLASIVGTQLVLADILSFGLVVSLSDRVSATIHDIAGLATVLPILISVALLLAFIIAESGRRILTGKRTYWYMAAGLTSLPAALILIKTLMGGTVFAAARTGFGMLLFALCGLFGGWLFARMVNRGKPE
jgi:hypothetical protein